MASAIVGKRRFTIEEYFELEERSEDKLEYFDGTIETMSGGTDIHNQIAARLMAVLVNLTDELGDEYIVYSSDMKIHLPSRNSFVYADAVVVCRRPEFYEGKRDVITNPLLIVEIMSPSTQRSDRGLKFLDYRAIPTFKEYLLVSQNEPRITAFFREQPGTWKEEEAAGMDARLILRSVNGELPLGKVFKGVKFEEI